MARGPYYTTVTAIGHPVRTTMRSSSFDGVIGHSVHDFLVCGRRCCAFSDLGPDLDC